MEFGLVMPQHGAFANRASLERMARAAEDMGFASIWAIDHIIIPRPFVARFSDRVYGLFSTLGFLAGITDRVKLGTTVIVLPYRHPVTLAKEMASVDDLSGGRTIYGVAFGWIREEYEALDVPFARRGARADEMLRIMDRLWSDGPNDFKGEFYEFGDFAFDPPPVQKPRPPIWIGGNNERALERVVKYGDGWHPITSARRPGSVQWTVDDLRRRLRLLDRMAEEAGRDPASIARSLHATLAFDIDAADFLGDGYAFTGSRDDICRKLDEAREMGLEHITLNPWYTIPGRIHEPTVDTAMATVERFVSEVMGDYAG